MEQKEKAAGGGGWGVQGQNTKAKKGGNRSLFTNKPSTQDFFFFTSSPSLGFKLKDGVFLLLDI